jgi:hypothetical protein
MFATSRTITNGTTLRNMETSWEQNNADRLPVGHATPDSIACIVNPVEHFPRELRVLVPPARPAFVSRRRSSTVTVPC